MVIMGYNHIDGVTNAYCWAHARRKFYDALPVDMKNASDTLANATIEKKKPDCLR